MQPFAWVLCSTSLGGRGLRPWLHQARAGRAAPTRWWGVSHLGGRGAPPTPRASQARPRAPTVASYSHCTHSSASACQAPEKAGLGPFFSNLGLGAPSQGLVLGHSKPPRGHLWLGWGPFLRRAAVPPWSGPPAHPEKKFNWPQSGGCPGPQMGATPASWAGLPGKGKAPSRQPTCGSKPGAPHVGSVGAGRK